MLPDDPRHGSRAGWDRHRKDDEVPCQPCRDAAARYQRGLKWDHFNNKRRTVDPTGSARRMQGLVALGYNLVLLGEMLGGSTERARKIAIGYHSTIRLDTAAKVAELYERLSMTLPPEATPGERKAASYARTVARRYGWLPPLAWDDIDDPNERPTDWAYRAPTRAETVADLDERGAGISEVCRVLGITKDTLERWCVRQGQWETFVRLRDRETWRESA